MRKYNKPSYKSTVEKYPLQEAIATAVAVDRVNGFVKSGGGYYDSENDRQISDNRMTCLATLRDNCNTVTLHPLEIESVAITDADRKTADEIFSYFDQSLLLQKMGDSYDNDFNKVLATIFNTPNININ